MDKIRHRRPHTRGFSLVESLVTVSIISILAALSAAGVSKALGSAAKAREISAGSVLMKGYLTAAADNEGRFMAGMDYSVKDVFKADGKKLSPSHAGQRYPFRLAPYLGNTLDGSILVNGNGRQIEKMYSRSSGMYDYCVSLFPAMGINRYFVGGEVNSRGEVAFAGDCIVRTAQATSSVLVFASGGSMDGSSEKVDGYNIITPPNTTQALWNSTPWKAGVDPSLYGYVDGRYDSRAVCAFLDGSVKMLSIEELRDMRLWSVRAAESGSSNYMIPR